MRKIADVYRFANLISLDIVAGAIVSSLFFARIFRVTILPWGLAAMGLTVWIIYTSDHLLDAMRLSGPASTDRHRFHQTHFRSMLYLTIAALIADVVAVALIRKPLINAGFLLGLIVAIYLLVQGKLKWLKEISGAVLYCLGVTLPSLSLGNYVISGFEGLVMTEFGVVVFCNLLLFSLFDVREDILDRHHSFVTVMGVKRTRWLLIILFVISGSLIGIHLYFFPRAGAPAFVMLLMTLILFLLFLFPRRFRANRSYRLLGDSIFLIPAFFLLFL